MSYNFSTSDIIEFVNKNSSLVDYSFSRFNCDYNVSKSKINEDVLLLKHSLSTQDEDIKITEESYPYKGVYINICLEGARVHNSLVCPYNADFKESYSTISFVNELEGVSCFPKKTKHKNISMFIRESYLPQYVLEKIQVSEPIKLLNFSPTSLRVKLLAKQIYKSPFVGDLHDIYIQSKALEVLYHELSTIPSVKQKNNKYASVIFSQYDKEALKKVKEIILSSIDTPPSIASLSKRVKLNEFKLKVGFKKFYGITLYEFYLECRMNKAKELLNTSEYNISEIATLVGYKHIQSFSSAFRKRYGINPKDLIQKRKYYY